MEGEEGSGSESLRTAPLPRHRPACRRAILITILRERLERHFKRDAESSFRWHQKCSGRGSLRCERTFQTAIMLPYEVRFTGAPLVQGMPVWTGRTCTC